VPGIVRAPVRSPGVGPGSLDARFNGTVVGRGAPQADTFTLTLNQSGDLVTGTVRVEVPT
jgi:hypothetical protein